ncbi:hypothetical protein TELCIR_16538 [Teladorsagia circumcincta]|uniref:Uncharacterized protein n=1 Tax=Teladorsagia circumcincta TaxID=45464 RepID=A0A2G9TV77_TELCI|nr:hypothetical protein TELCIR_16538 [Teladorsagia circumcincta]
MCGPKATFRVDDVERHQAHTRSQGEVPSLGVADLATMTDATTCYSH